MMKGSFVYPGFDNENDDNNNKNNNYDEFDPQTDFSQFLEEAKRQASEDKENNNPIPEIGENKQVIIVDEEIKKSKKWWKTVLFSFWRSSSSSDNKSKKHSTEILSTNNVNVTHTNKPQGYVSSPLYNPGNVAATSTGRSRYRLSGCGPLIGLFQPKKREDEETEIPYVSLNNKPTQDNTGVYGPVYLVS